MKNKKITIMLAAAAMFVLLFSMTAFADSRLVMSTGYPGISAKAGEQVSFNLDFVNNTGSGLKANLETSYLPEDWSGYFEGNSKEITSIYLSDGKTNKGAVYNVLIPEDTKDGNYKITLKVSGEDCESVLDINLKVSAVALGGSVMKADYDSQQGTVGTNFTFTTTITNNATDDQSFSFSYKLPDAGWQISFKPQGESTQVSAMTVPGKENKTVNISVIPSTEVVAGDYTIPIKAISASETLEENVTIKITGAYKMNLSTPTGNLAVSTTAKKKTPVTLNLTNTGNIPLENINLKSTAPDGWTVEYSETDVDYLEAGATKEVTAYITPSDEVMNGDYVCVLSAKTQEASSDATFRITVKTETVWGIVGVLVIIGALAGLLIIFKKYGRR